MRCSRRAVNRARWLGAGPGAAIEAIAKSRARGGMHGWEGVEPFEPGHVHAGSRSHSEDRAQCCPRTTGEQRPSPSPSGRVRTGRLGEAVSGLARWCLGLWRCSEGQEEEEEEEEEF